MCLIKTCTNGKCEEVTKNKKDGKVVNSQKLIKKAVKKSKKHHKKQSKKEHTKTEKKVKLNDEKDKPKATNKSQSTKPKDEVKIEPPILSLSQQTSSTDKAHQLFSKIQAYCSCIKSLAQKKNDTTGDKVCSPVASVSGVDCKLDGFNVTIDALKNIVTDKPAPITKPLEPEPTKAALTQKGSQATTDKAQALMSKVKNYCSCVNRKSLAQSKNETIEEGDKVCTPLDGLTGVDCKLDGFNVTIEALKNIVTDKPAPITKPLEPEPTKEALT